MMIRVKYPNGVTEMVRPPLLQHLIASQKIVEFRRSEGWAVIGVDRVRGRTAKIYSGPERRATALKR